jgi:hypothetical protein
MPYPEKLKKSLHKHNVDESIINQIFEGHEDLDDKASKRKKISFFTQAMKKMDELMDYDTKYEIIDWCACCKGGKRDKDVKKLGKELKGKNLEEKLKALWEVPNMGKPILDEDGNIKTGIYYKGEEGFKCACPCLHDEKIEESISSTYCLCCAGHFRYHYQNALGVKLKTIGVVSSPITSLGKEPCEFAFEILE